MPNDLKMNETSEPPVYRVDLHISEDWTTFDPHKPEDEVAALAQFDELVQLTESYGDDFSKAVVHQMVENSRMGFEALGQVGVTILGTWARLVVADDVLRTVSGWFNLAVIATPGSGEPDLAGERDGIIADSLTTPTQPGVSTLVSAETVDLPIGSALRVIWEIVPDNETLKVPSYRTTQYLVPLADGALRAMLTCTSVRDEFDDDWDEVFLAVAASMELQVVEPEGSDQS